MPPARRRPRWTARPSGSGPLPFKVTCHVVDTTDPSGAGLVALYNAHNAPPGYCNGVEEGVSITTGGYGDTPAFMDLTLSHID